MNQQQRLPRCPKGMHRNKSSGLCEPKSLIIKRKSPMRKSKSPTRQSPIKRKSPERQSHTMTVNQKRCPKGMHRNKISGLCEHKSIVKRKSPERQSPVKRKSPKKRKKKIQKKFITPIKSRLTSPTNSSFMLRNRKGVHDENFLLTKKILKFYKNNATPIRVGGTDIHTGEIKFLKIALRYFKNNYDNFSYFKSPFDDKIDNLTFFVYKVGEQSDEIMVAIGGLNIIFRLVKTETGYELLNEHKDYSEHFFILDMVVERIKKSIRKGKRFFVTNISLQSVYRKTAHANVLIFDTLKNTLELFDPHGYNTLGDYDPKNVRFLIEYIFKKISPRAHFLNSFEMNPLYGLQYIESLERSEKVENEIGGYCGAWVLFYLHMRLANPDVPQIRLIQNIKEEIIDKGNFTNFIRNYAKYITNEGGYRHKFDIKPRNILF